MEGRCNWLIQC